MDDKGGIGFDLLDTDNNTLSGNTTTDDRSPNLFGFSVGNCSGSSITDNTATNFALGFEADSGNVDNTYTGNTARGNGTGFLDRSSGGSGTAGTDNTHTDNVCIGDTSKSDPPDLC